MEWNIDIKIKITPPTGSLHLSTAPSLHLRLLVHAQRRFCRVRLDPVTPVIQIIHAVPDVLVDLLGNIDEGHLDALPRLGARLDERLQSVRLSPHSRLLARDLPLLLAQIALVPDEDDGDVGFGRGAELVEPLLHVGEGVAPRDVVDEQRAGGAAKVGLGDGAERLLAGGVPDLELDLLVVVRGVARDDAGAEFDAYSDVVGGVEAPFAEPDCELCALGSVWGAEEGRGERGGGRTEDLPQPESPMLTTFLSAGISCGSHWGAGRGLTAM